mmetsp:Transcript_82903/g.232362  ORF Transcript_82903/g.232362 Transcript_82903/m.232362 type:complete len:231 (+) Transcript_82903:226-918(+)
MADCASSGRLAMVKRVSNPAWRTPDSAGSWKMYTKPPLSEKASERPGIDSPGSSQQKYLAPFFLNAGKVTGFHLCNPSANVHSDFQGCAGRNRSMPPEPLSLGFKARTSHKLRSESKYMKPPNSTSATSPPSFASCFVTSRPSNLATGYAKANMVASGRIPKCSISSSDMMLSCSLEMLPEMCLSPAGSLDSKNRRVAKPNTSTQTLHEAISRSPWRMCDMPSNVKSVLR